MMGLLTVRLSSEDEKAVKALRAEGVAVADLVRGTIQREYELRKKRRRSAKEVRELIAEIEAAHPIPAGSTRPPVNTLDRKAVREFITAKMKAKARR